MAAVLVHLVQHAREKRRDEEREPIGAARFAAREPFGERGEAGDVGKEEDGVAVVAREETARGEMACDGQGEEGKQLAVARLARRRDAERVRFRPSPLHHRDDSVRLSTPTTAHVHATDKARSRMESVKATIYRNGVDITHRPPPFPPKPGAASTARHSRRTESNSIIVKNHNLPKPFHRKLACHVMSLCL